MSITRLINRVGFNVELSVTFSPKNSSFLINFSHNSNGHYESWHIETDGGTPFPFVKLNQKNIKSLIALLNGALVASQMREPDYEPQRGISVPVETNPTRD